MSMCHGVATSALASWQLAASFPFALDQRNNAAQEAILQLSTVPADDPSWQPTCRMSHSWSPCEPFDVDCTLLAFRMLPISNPCKSATGAGLYGDRLLPVPAALHSR